MYIFERKKKEKNTSLIYTVLIQIILYPYPLALFLAFPILLGVNKSLGQ